MGQVQNQLSTAVMMHPEIFDEDGDPWFILHTLSRQEKALAQALEALDLRFFLPLRRQVKFHGRQRCDVLSPLFANYLFVRAAPDDIIRADRTRRVANVISVYDQERLESEVRNIHLAIANEVAMDLHPYLRKGIRVEVRSGPMRGLRGLIKDHASNNRLILQVDMLGQATAITIDGSLLDPID